MIAGFDTQVNVTRSPMGNCGPHKKDLCHLKIKRCEMANRRPGSETSVTLTKAAYTSKIVTKLVSMHSHESTFWAGFEDDLSHYCPSDVLSWFQLYVHVVHWSRMNVTNHYPQHRNNPFELETFLHLEAGNQAIAVLQFKFYLHIINTMLILYPEISSSNFE